MRCPELNPARGRSSRTDHVEPTSQRLIGGSRLSVTALLWFPPLLGGVVIMVAAAVILRVQRTLRAYDALDPQP